MLQMYSFYHFKYQNWKKMIKTKSPPLRFAPGAHCGSVAGETVHAGQKQARVVSTTGQGHTENLGQGPINPRRPVLVKGRSETGTPSAVTGTVSNVFFVIPSSP